MLSNHLMTTLIFTGLLFGCGGGSQKSAEEVTTEPETISSKLVGEEVEYSADTITMKGYLAYDASQQGPRPGILVVHEWWGHNAYARKRADMLAEMGYTALAVDMYGDGKTANHPDDAGKFSQEVFENIEGGMARFNAALELIKDHPTTDPEKIAAIGYCFGGGVVLHMARSGADLDGVVSFHGSFATETPAQEGDVIAAVLVCHGADDSFVPAEQVEGIKNEMEAAKVDFTFKAYPGAVHSFTNPDADAFGEKFELPLAYNEAADSQSWEAMQAFFSRIFRSEI